MNDLSQREIVYYSYLFSLNYDRSQLAKAFSKSHLGANYFIQKWEEFLSKGGSYTDAYFDLFFSLDHDHTEFLITYIFEKYETSILKARKWKSILENPDNFTETE